MLLAIVGSVNVTPDQSSLAATIISGFIRDYDPDLIISGGADGIDGIAELMADARRIPKRIHIPKEANWKHYKQRNILIAEDCTHLLCIRTKQSTTYGSGWTADRAEEMGKTVWRVQI